ncbi:hypothetical protein [Thermoactinomyces mirandus]|uniref:Uncharacterized protein n=1 Tax=Thermoactinomyces mirandus TaxID=2756294 RepID=A0A7W1XPD8_9BACL|nr:hypothetical protein [Thermoactinomyces mirandus]MBA4600834.1 hypothetical protein [Thermoactinomyces mirandus]
MGKIFWNFALEKAIREALSIQKGQGTWEEWESRWPPEVREKAERELKIFTLLGWLKR